MSFYPCDPEKTDVARRTEDGLKAIAFPATGLTERKVLLENCRSCGKRNSHGPCEGIAIAIPHGEHRYQQVPEANTPRVDDLNRMQSALFSSDFAVNGYIDDSLIWGTADGNNGSQFVDAEILSASGNTLTLSIPSANPKRLSLGGRRLNPEWPLADPATGSYAKLIDDGTVTRLPPGAQVEFFPPSVLAGKLRAMITRVNPPASDADGASFTVELWANASRARSPLDISNAPADGKYWCRIRWEARGQQYWLNAQAPNETAFTPRYLKITTPTATLTNTGGGNTRVLYPDMFADAFTVVLYRNNGAIQATLADAQVKAALATTQSATPTWSTAIDLSAHWITSTPANVTDTSHAILNYWCEALATDTQRLQFQASCSNSQVDPSGSYAHHGGRFCANVESSKFAFFRAQCWQPDCDGFSLGDASGHYGATPTAPVSRFDDATFWGGIYSRENWVVSQNRVGGNGARDINIERKPGGGPSIQSLVGGFIDEVPAGKFRFRSPLNPARMGKLKEWTDASGNDHHAIVPGAWYARAYDYASSDGPSYSYQVTGTAEVGVIADNAAGWTTKTTPIGVAMADELEYLPWRLTGRTDVYDYDVGGSALHTGSDSHSATEAFVVGVGRDDVDSALDTEVRARFA